MRADDCACRISAVVDAAEWLSRLSAAETARERLRETLRRGLRPAARSRAAASRVLSEAGGAGSCTPARLALDSPIAIACLVDRAPCLPSLANMMYFFAYEFTCLRAR